MRLRRHPHPVTWQDVGWRMAGVYDDGTETAPMAVHARVTMSGVECCGEVVCTQVGSITGVRVWTPSWSHSGTTTPSSISVVSRGSVLHLTTSVNFP